MPRVVHIEIHATDPVRAARVYAGLLGWESSKWGDQDFRLVTTGADDQAGINGGLLTRRGPPPAEGQPVNAYVCTIAVDSVDQTVERGVSLGATVAVAKMAIPGVGWLAYLKDPDGNIFGVMQEASDAA